MAERILSYMGIGTDGVEMISSQVVDAKVDIEIPFNLMDNLHPTIILCLKHEGANRLPCFDVLLMRFLNESITEKDSCES